MKLGIMQPYLFPYIGYFQYIAFVDKFVSYDDVTFIKQGWINRNRILLNGEIYSFSVPVENISSFKAIRDTHIHIVQYDKWKQKFYKTIEQAYKKAPFYQQIFPVLKDTFDTENKNINQIATKSIKNICSYLNIDTVFVDSSVCYQNSSLSGEARVIDICKKENANEYVNPAGGMSLYVKGTFAEHGITLHFIRSKPIVYEQFDNLFVPNLSIIDVLMFNPVEQVQEMLTQYEII